MFEYAAQLAGVHDGDTQRYDVDLGFGVWMRGLDVRLFGIDCPELGRPDGLGERARDFVAAWFAAHPGQIEIRTFKDRHEKFGRWLADVWSITAGTGVAHDLTDDLEAAGLAKRWDGHGPRPVWP